MLNADSGAFVRHSHTSREFNSHKTTKCIHALIYYSRCNFSERVQICDAPSCGEASNRQWLIGGALLLLIIIAYIVVIIICGCVFLLFFLYPPRFVLIIAYFFWLLCAFCGISVVFLLFNTDNNRLTFFLTDHFWGSALSRDLMSMRSSKPFFLFMFSQVEILNH